jgi:putative flavoprotein involved in K+ transport
VSLQALARQGAVILGRLLDVAGDNLLLSDEAAANVRFADEASRRRKDAIDRHLSRLGVDLPLLEDDPADEPDPRAECASPLRRLALREAGVGAIVWATGFKADFGWIRPSALDADGTPMHERGISSVPGLYFVGFPWLSKRKSGFIYGAGEDAEHIAAAVMRHLRCGAIRP